MFYDHRNKSHLALFANRLKTHASDSQKGIVVAYCLATQLMLHQNFFLKILVWIARLKNPQGAGFLPLVNALNHPKVFPNLTLSMWEQTLNWLVNGTDASDSTSAGGFNRPELNRLIGLCRTINLFEDSSSSEESDNVTDDKEPIPAH